MNLSTMPQTTESEVRSYSRSFPTIFTAAKGDVLRGHDGSTYIDFLAGAGTLNYGHNPETVKRRLIDYLESDGLTHGLDLTTSAKLEFLNAFTDCVLEPRGLGYRVQFCGPTGTNAVEAALKLARLVTGRTNVIAFSGAFHGVSTGSLAATASNYYRSGLHTTLGGTTHLPYPDSPLGEYDTMDLLRRLVEDPGAGTAKPAAVLLETVQGEGGVYVAPTDFLRELREFCDRHQILLIVDDIQAGCGRTGSFFSFERAGIEPDLITLSKSIGGYGLPMAVVLIKPQYDIWRPGQHNGTFRGNQLAFVAAAAVLREYWADGPDGAFVTAVRGKGREVARRLGASTAVQLGARVRGLGLMWGLDLSAVPDVSAGKVSHLCFDRGLIVETCGRDGEVIKVLPPLTISDENLSQGLDILLDVLQCAVDGTSAA
ncbi:diaminobutyrate--2-oxoglutarate transaminase [Actinoplanes campanulatus]|nr:diaminobutyrate--2-oxoglutarate transaminase [Actinoplanes campanulatus]GID34600.1 diaminobutyrate--2-oxoglutarate transaminase [Actinoplanes campanulatus]